jgi:hypothetical protein
MRLRNAKLEKLMQGSMPASTGAVRKAEDSTLSCGRVTPAPFSRMRDQAPPATNTAPARTRPRSVTMPATRPPTISMLRTAQA